MYIYIPAERILFWIAKTFFCRMQQPQSQGHCMDYANGVVWYFLSLIMYPGSLAILRFCVLEKEFHTDVKTIEYITLFLLPSTVPHTTSNPTETNGIKCPRKSL